MKKKFKKAIAVLLALLMVTTTISMFPLTVSSAEKTEESVGATSGTTGDCTWTNNNGHVTISGEGRMADYSSYTDSPWYGQGVKSVVIEQGVTNVGKHAFTFCYDLESVSMADSVTEIGANAFSNCWRLSEISLSNSLKNIGGSAFLNNYKLNNVVIPASVTSIGEGVFKSCESMTSISVDSANTIYDSRDNCNAIIKTGSNTLLYGFPGTVIPNSVRTIGEKAFYYNQAITSVTIPDGVTTIEEDAFLGCYNLKTVSLPDSVSSIGESAFLSCSKLTYVHIPTALTEISENVFCGCSQLTELTIPENIKRIRDDAFAACSKLTDIWIPASVTFLENNPFERCSGLNSIAVDNSNPVYDSRNNCNAVIKTAANKLVCGCANTIIPDGVKEIGTAAFSGCSELTHLNIPDSVTVIGEEAFWFCDELEEIVIPENVTTIGRMAFELCQNLTSVTIPDSVTKISSSAFSRCTSLNNIIIPDSVTEIESSAFEGCTSLNNIIIPDSITEIEHFAFKGCTSLMSITIPSSVTRIDDRAFGYGDFDYKVEGFVIRGIRNTEAQRYAEENGFEFIALDETQPTDPQTEPTQPEIQPTDPQTEPTQPETQPTDPQTEPTQPETQPTDPQTEPTQPEIQPTDPQTEPTQSEIQPTDPQTEPTEPIDENAPAFEITGATAKAEETVTLDLSIKNNPGITSFRVYIDYPEDALTLTDVEFKDLFSGKASGKNSLTSPYNVLWFSADSADENCNGIIATLTFTINENTAAGDYPINLTCSADDIFNSQFEDVSFAAVSSTVKVIEYFPGDANGDNEINMKDVVLLRQYLNEWDVEIDERALDVNRDGKINMKDIVLLQQYLNDWDVVLY